MYFAEARSWARQRQGFYYGKFACRFPFRRITMQVCANLSRKCSLHGLQEGQEICFYEAKATLCKMRLFNLHKMQLTIAIFPSIFLQSTFLRSIVAETRPSDTPSLFPPSLDVLNQRLLNLTSPENPYISPLNPAVVSYVDGNSRFVVDLMTFIATIVPMPAALSQVLIQGLITPLAPRFLRRVFSTFSSLLDARPRYKSIQATVISVLTPRTGYTGMILGASASLLSTKEA